MILKYFDKLEDKVRHKLSRYPKTYAFITGLATILAWVAIWAMASNFIGDEKIDGGFQWLLIIFLCAISLGTLLITGAFINLFGDSKVIERTLKEEGLLIEKEEIEIKDILNEIKSIRQDLREISDKINQRMS